MSSLYREVSGDGGGVVFLHAGICDGRMWDGLADAVGPGYRMVAYDLRGFGRSPWAVGGPFSHVDDLFAVLDAEGLESATLVGASHGGKVAIDAALERPERVRGLLLLAPAIGGWTWSPALEAYGREEDELFEAGDLDAVVELNLRTWVDGPHRMPVDVDPGVRERVGEMQRLVLDLYVGAEATGIEPGPDRALDPPAASRLAELAAPTLVILGALDQPDMLEIGAALGREVSGATVRTFDGTAHLPGMERPEEFARVLRDFLGEVASA